MQQIQSWDFLAPKYSTLNCQLYYNNLEVFGNNSKSAMNGAGSVNAAFCSQSLQIFKRHVAFRLAQEQCPESFIEWISMTK